jgi:hypothetical protein
MLKDVYATPRIKEHIAAVYRLGIEFSREAAMYYSLRTRKRLWHVISRPPGTDIREKVAAITTAIGEMVDEMETLDRIRLSSVEKGVALVNEKADRLEEKADRLERSIEGSQNHFRQKESPSH